MRNTYKDLYELADLIREQYKSGSTSTPVSNKKSGLMTKEKDNG